MILSCQGWNQRHLWLVRASPLGVASTDTPPDPHPPCLPGGLECPLPRPPTLACRSLFNSWMKLIYWRRDGHPTGSSAPAGPRRPLMLPQLHVWSTVQPAAAAPSFPAGQTRSSCDTCQRGHLWALGLQETPSVYLSCSHYFYIWEIKSFTKLANLLHL